MKRLRNELRDDERGFTLPEMMVTILMMIVVLFALYGIFDASIRVFAFGNDRLEATQNARLGLERMEREIRAAYPQDDDELISNFGPNPSEEIEFENRLDNGSSETIIYDLNGNTLERNNQPVVEKVRVDDPSTQEDETGLMLSYLTSDVSTYAASEQEIAVVRIELTVEAGEGDQTLTTDVNLRNRE